MVPNRRGPEVAGGLTRLGGCSEGGAVDRKTAVSVIIQPVQLRGDRNRVREIVVHRRQVVQRGKTVIPVRSGNLHVVIAGAGDAEKVIVRPRLGPPIIVGSPILQTGLGQALGGARPACGGAGAQRDFQHSGPDRREFPPGARRGIGCDLVRLRPARVSRIRPGPREGEGGSRTVIGRFRTKLQVQPKLVLQPRRQTVVNGDLVGLAGLHGHGAR